MAKDSRQTLQQIIKADQRSFEKFGVGNAMAQPYHHTILPLASARDKRTQIKWGVADFQHHFGHDPVGMWLPEAAVDNETLEILAEFGIRFTILAPWQAEADQLDIKQPYRVELRNGKSIAVFFYHSGMSAGISFDPAVTMNADHFIHSWLAHEFSDLDEDQFLIIASDGELYGHHQPFRDRFLSHLMNGALHQAEIEYSYPGRWLAEHPPIKNIKIRENTSWSCAHGVERWKEECGCTPVAAWKKPLREFLNTVADDVDEVYQRIAGEWIGDVWQARDEYIHVMLGDETFESWQARHVSRPLNPEDSTRLRCLLEAQVERQRMFTSCGWFFDDFDRIEPVNNVVYATHAVELTRKVIGGDNNRALYLPMLSAITSQRTALCALDVFNNAIERFQKD